MNFISKIGTIVTDPKTIRELLRFRFVGYLKETGWIESIRQQQPVDQDGKPLPWMTLPFIHFLDSRLTSSMTIFEFGSGNSTKYFRRKVDSVRSIEHDPAWFERLQNDDIRGIIEFQPLDEADRYEKKAVASGKQYHIIVVDGRRRVRCIINSISALRSDGVMVLDDSEREEYAEGVQFLHQHGFKRLDFWGMAPGMHDNKCTSLFYRTENCLGI